MRTCSSRSTGKSGVYGVDEDTISGTVIVGARMMIIVVATMKSRTRKVAGLRAAGGIRSVIPNLLPELWRGSDMMSLQMTLYLVGGREVEIQDTTPE